VSVEPNEFVLFPVGYGAEGVSREELNPVETLEDEVKLPLANPLSVGLSFEVSLQEVGYGGIVLATEEVLTPIILVADEILVY
jgi:hypothetical protein